MLQRHTHLFNLQFLYISITFGRFESRRLKLILLLVNWVKVDCTWLCSIWSVSKQRDSASSPSVLGPTDRPTNQPTNLSIDQFTNRQTNQVTNYTTVHPTNQASNHTTSEPTNKPSNQDSLKADSYIACRSHAVPMPFPCRAMPLRV